MWRICTGGRRWESRCQNRYERHMKWENIIKIGGREREYQNRKTALGFCSDLWVCLCYTWQLGSENCPPSSLSLLSPCLMLCHSFFPSLPLIYHSFQVFAPGVLPVVQRGARCTFVLLSGPVWAQGAPTERTRTVLLSRHIPVNEGYGKEGVGWGGVGGGFKTGGAVFSLCVWCVWLQRLHSTLHSPPALSRSILSLEEPQGRQMHLPEIHTPGPDAYLPHLQSFTEILHVPHTLVSTYTPLEREHRGTSQKSEIWI